MDGNQIVTEQNRRLLAEINALRAQRDYLLGRMESMQEEFLEVVKSFRYGGLNDVGVIETAGRVNHHRDPGGADQNPGGGKPSRQGADRR